jgi:hypothetical protein
MEEDKISKDARISDPYVDRRSGEDRRQMMQIIFKMVDWKEEVVKSEGDITKDGRIVQE